MGSGVILKNYATNLTARRKPPCMARRPRNTPGGIVYHVLNRAVARLGLFEKPADYVAFLRCVADAKESIDCRVLSYCVMPNHWHFLLWPRGHGELSQFMRLVTLKHTQRWHAHYGSSGTGSIYQGRFKSFPVKDDRHFLTVARYVERNALRANLVERAEDWPWSSLIVGSSQVLKLSDWPIQRPDGWLELVNRPETYSELVALRKSVFKGAPFGDAGWQKQIAKALGIESSLKSPGRPPARTNYS